MRLAGKVSLVSGGALGQGSAEVKLFAQEGSKVIIGDILDQEGLKLEAEINESGGDATFVHLDVTTEADWQHATETALSKYGRLDVLVNNAGIWQKGLVADTSEEQWDLMMDVNAKGVFLGSKLAVSAMLKTGGGSIINISSTSGLVGSPGAAAYAASKGAVRLLTKNIAVQYGMDGIRANSIHPGPIDTSMGNQIWETPEARQAAAEVGVLGRVGIPSDIAYGALYLASDESTFVTGSELVIDGGQTAQ